MRFFDVIYKLIIFRVWRIILLYPHHPARGKIRRRTITGFVTQKKKIGLGRFKRDFAAAGSGDDFPHARCAAVRNVG